MENKPLSETKRSHAAYSKNAAPFYQIIMDGLKGEVEGEHFWDAVDDDAVFEFLYHFPGFASKIQGRAAYMDWFAGYTMKLKSADNLRVYKCANPANTIILEYQVHGTAPNTGKAYNNNFCSIITLKNRKIVAWRDYMDTLAVIDAVNNG